MRKSHTVQSLQKLPPDWPANTASTSQHPPSLTERYGGYVFTLPQKQQQAVAMDRDKRVTKGQGMVKGIPGLDYSPHLS
jgi:hypothetical protein